MSVSVGNDDGIRQVSAASVDDHVDDRESELGTKSSVEACTSLSCLSPRASTDALLPNFQPDDDADVKSPSTLAVAEHAQRSYPGAVPPFAARRNRSPRSDEQYLAHSHATSYSGHSPRPEVSPSALHRPSYSEEFSHNSPHGTSAAVEDLTSHAKLECPFVEIRRDQLNQSQNVGDDNVGREIVRSNEDLLRVDTSMSAVGRQSRDHMASHVSQNYCLIQTN